MIIDEFRRQALLNVKCDVVGVYAMHLCTRKYSKWMLLLFAAFATFAAADFEGAGGDH